jgi:uncharacterized iron-regulated membrane protein
MPATRAIILVHRYLGIGLGLLMALWCLSGVVMIYVPYPQLTDAERLASLPPIDWNRCCVLDGPDALEPGTRIASFQLEMLGEVPLLRLVLDDGSLRLTNPTDGRVLSRIGTREAWAAASQFGRSHDLSMRNARYALIDHDQWTVGGFHADRPLHWVEFNDADGTEVYVSSRTGKVVQRTTRSQRFWSWVGAVPHWLYPSILRRHPEVWAQVVIWTSLLGTFLTIAGLYIGIRQLQRRGDGGGLASPYRGILFWHHVPGLVFGVFALTWVVSGLLSVNPWGWLETRGFAADRANVQGEAPSVETVRQLLNSVPRNSPERVVSVRSAVLDGQLFAISTGMDGERRRFATRGTPAELNEAHVRTAAQKLVGNAQPFTWELLTAEDTYHYSVGRAFAQLPAIRITSGATLYYIDAVTGDLINKADAGGRGYRWWHSALHRLDFTAALRTSLGRTLLMLPLLLGATFVCIVGAYLGVRRLTR